MAVMSQKVNLSFEVAPAKKEQFLKESSQSKAIDQLMQRAAKNMRNLTERTIVRK